MREFSIPEKYRSSTIASLKYTRQQNDPYKKDFSPSIIDYDRVRFKIARHFGFCFGVQNALEKAYQAVEENQGRRIFLVSEMIHNNVVNDDLRSRGVKFLLSSSALHDLKQIEENISLLQPSDVVIIPAFGVTFELLEKIKAKGVETRIYDTTCPFVQRVWRRAQLLGSQGFSIVIHGRHHHEEAQATFSHACRYAPSIMIKDINEAQVLADFIIGKVSLDEFQNKFADVVSSNFSPERDLLRIGVVNQTTMLAEETREISLILRSALIHRFGEENIAEHFSDTNDTLCYATTENQEAVKNLISSGGDLALVVGGYNSSNTSHLVELLEEKVPTFYISSADEIIDLERIRHFDLREKRILVTEGWFPKDLACPEILLTAGASCPDKSVDEVLAKVKDFLTVGNK